jgi:type IV pilus assembly protein PilB
VLPERVAQGLCPEASGHKTVIPGGNDGKLTFLSAATVETPCEATMNDNTLHAFVLSEGLASHSQLNGLLTLQRSTTPPTRLLRLLVAHGYVSDKTLAKALSRWLSIPWVRIEDNDVTAALLSLVPREIARRFTLFPVYLRRGPNSPTTLFVAMDDPTWEEALLTVTVVAGMPVRPLVATRAQLLAAIERHYEAPNTERPTYPALPAAENDDVIVVEYPSDLSCCVAVH